MATNDRRDTRLEVCLIAGLFVCTLALCLYRLDIYPASWFDEGITLEVSKNLVLYGRYAISCMPDGLQEFAPAIQAGPTILLPIALVFRLFGIGIVQARLVMMLYAISALAAFYWLVRNVCGRKVAFLASLLLIFTFDHEFTSFVFMGRQVLAEVPALAFFWLGTLAWFRSWQSRRWVALVWPGLLWGLAMLTKVQFALILPVALVLFWLLERIFGKKLRVYCVLIPILVSGGCMLTWYVYQAFSLGFADFWQQTMELGAAGGVHFLGSSPRRMMSAIFQLLGSSPILFGLPGIFYAVGSNLRNRDAKGYAQIFLGLFTVVWLGWYAFLSIGWMRYAFVSAATSSIFSAWLLMYLWNAAGQVRQILSRRLPLTLGQVSVGGVMVMLLLSGLVPMAERIIRSHDNGLQDFAHYLNTHVPTDQVIESWEWEVDLLTAHSYHHPPYEVTNITTEHLWYGSSIPPNLYDPLAFHPAYLIIGPFANWTGIYSRELAEQECVLVKSIGEYSLYKVNDGG